MKDHGLGWFLASIAFGCFGIWALVRPIPVETLLGGLRALFALACVAVAGWLTLAALDLWLSHRRHVTPVDEPRRMAANVKVQRDEPFRVSTKPERSGRRSV